MPFKEDNSLHTSFIIPIYNCQVDFIITNEVEEVALEAGYKQDCSGCEGITLGYPSNPSIYCLILRNSTLDEGVIAHECFHLTSKVMEACDIKYDPDNIEPFNYLLEYIVNQIHGLIKEHKEMIEKDENKVGS